MDRPWGFSMHIDIEKCRSFEPKDFLPFIDGLVGELEMKKFGEPTVEYFGTEWAKGYSVVQLIETSCITFHTTDDHNDVYLDVFSCKPFEAESVLEYVQMFMDPVSVKFNFLVRKVNETK